MQQVDDPPYLSVGTEVSAKYKGAFCEAKVRKVVRNIKCKVAYKQGLGSGTVSDDLVKGVLRVGATVEVKHPDKRDYVEASITKIQDCSQYTVVFDDGDITTLRRTALCLKSGRHFNESETLDQLPLTHPEHFGNPVIGGRRGRRSRHLQDDSSDEDDDHDPKTVVNEKEEHIGKVVCVESTDSKKKDKDKWFPGLVVSPTAQVTVRIRVKDEYLVRSFKDGRYYTVPKKEATEFTREVAVKQEGPAVIAALEYLDNDTLPTHWDRDALFGLSNSSSEYEGEFESDSSDDEPREEKDHFVAQLYKYMDDRGTPLNKVPSITNKDVDLYRLFRAVQKLGGYNRVTSQNQWKAITLRLNFTPVTVSVTNLVKQAYKKFLQPFEEFDRKLGCSMSMTPRNTNRTKGRSLVRANSVASPKPEIKEPKNVPVVDESENTSESSMDATKTKRKLSTGGNKVKALVEKFEEKTKEEVEVVTKSVKNIPKEEAPVIVQPLSASPNIKKEKVTRKQPPPLEEKKTRKRKDGENEKASDKTADVPVSTEFPVDIGDKLKVYYHEKKVTYEAKVIEITIQQGTPLYLVHYTGWNNRYDEWVPKERIAENLTTNKVKRTKNSSNTQKNTMPPNEGVKSGHNNDKSPNISALIPTTSASKIITASKRGRGRSDSQPPRSTTPSSLASNSSRTKSPATPATQRRTTRAQPSISRRTSNNISDISVQSDSDTDSDEPVKRSDKSTSSAVLLSTNQSSGGTRKIDTIKCNVSTASNNQSETEEEDILSEAKGRDYDLNEIRSELKGFKELKSPSPETEINSQITTEKKTNLIFNFNSGENETKSSVPNLSKSSILVTEVKSSSTELSSETDSFADDDSQSSDKTTTLENMTEKLQQKIKAEKLAQAKRLEHTSSGSSNEKLISIKSSSIEKIIKDSLAEKMQETMKSKPFTSEKGTIKNIEFDDKERSMLEKKLNAPIPIEKKKYIQGDSKPISNRMEKILVSSEKFQGTMPKENLLESPNSKLLIADKEITDPVTSNTDIYEFKEPEPFEFETRKLSAPMDVEKKIKKPIQKTMETSPEIKSVFQATTSTKKNKKSPIKDTEKLKHIKIEDLVPPSIPTKLLSPTKIDITFDALRKSPSFNLNINALNEEFAATLQQESAKSLLDISENIFSMSDITSQANISFISPFVETIKIESTNIFDLKTDIANIERQSDDCNLNKNKSELETVKKILLSDTDFDLEPPKIDKPSSIADKVLKALNQQKQDEDKEKVNKEENNFSQIPETSVIVPFVLAEPPKIELSAIISKEIDISLKKPILSSPEPKLDILESIAPKNNDLSETIQKLESAIQKTSNVDHFDDDCSDSTDSEQRLVIEDDDSQSSETNQTEITNELPSGDSKKQENEKYQAKNEIKNEPIPFASQFPTSIFALKATNYSHSALLADAGLTPISDILPSLNSEGEDILKSELVEKSLLSGNCPLKTDDSLLSPDNQIMHSESINLLLCEETIPGSPTPAKENVEIKQIPHPIESDIKPIPMDIECGPISSSTEISCKLSKSENHTPNSSPRDSMSQDDSSEDIKKQVENDPETSPKKKKRTRKHSEAETLNKRRKINLSLKKNNASDSDENSDANTTQRSSSRPSRPCQYNFLVQLDPALNPNQRIGILKKKIQELRKTYNLIKAELASIDRRRKKLRRREREKKNQQKLNC